MMLLIAGELAKSFRALETVLNVLQTVLKNTNYVNILYFRY